MVKEHIIKGVIHTIAIVQLIVFKAMAMAVAIVMALALAGAVIFQIMVTVKPIVFRIMVMEDITEQQDPIMVMQVTIIDEMLPIKAMVIIQVVEEE